MIPQRFTPRVLAALAPVLAVAIAGCGSTASSAGSTPTADTRPATLNGLPLLRLNYFADANGQLANTLDPAQATASSDSDTIALANANLVRILPNGRVAPDLATWTTSPDRIVYTFTVRTNARFSNGRPVTASDAAFSIRRALAPATASSVALNYLGLIQGAIAFNTGKVQRLPGVQVLGPRTLKIRLVKPAAYFLDALSYPTADVLDPGVVGSKTAAVTGNFLSTNCPGNQGAGPFVFVCTGTRFYPSGQTPRYTLIPNRQYYGPRPHIAIQIPALPSVDVSYKTYEAGGIDVTAIPTGDLARWQHSAQYLAYPTSIVSYITPNTRTVPFNNTHCRLALSYGINRDVIANRLLHGASAPAYVIVPHGFLGWYNGRASGPHYDLGRARAEFAQCPNKSVPVAYDYPSGSSDSDNVGVTVASMMTQVGFHATPHALSANDWDNVVSQPMNRTGTLLVRNGWQQDYPDPQDYVSLLLRSNAPYNIGGWSDPAFDRLVDRADIASDPALRARLYEQAQSIALRSGAWIALSNALGHALIKPYVHGLVGTPAFGDLVPRDGQWADVRISTH